MRRATGRSMGVIQTVVQLSASHCVEECRVIFERTSNSTPNYFRFCFAVRQLRNQHVKRVHDPAAFVMHNVVVPADRCPNKALAWKRWIHDDISCVPLSARFCEFAFVPCANRDNRRWQIARGMHLVESRCVLQFSTIFCRKLCHIGAAEALNRHSEEHVKADVVRAQRLSPFGRRLRRFNRF